MHSTCPTRIRKEREREREREDLSRRDTERGKREAQGQE